MTRSMTHPSQPPNGTQGASRRLWRPLALILLALALVASAAAADWQSGVDAFQQGDYQAAEQAFRQLAESQPDWYGGHYMLGRVLVERDQAGEALQSLKRAHDIEARPEVSLLLARTALEQGSESLARTALADGPSAQLPQAQKVAWLSLRAQAAPDAPTRLEDLNAAIQMSPRDAGLRLAAADAAVEAKRFDDAIGHLDTAAELQPGDESVLVRRLKVRLTQSEAASGDDRVVACSRAAEAAAELAGTSGKAQHLSIAGRSYLCSGDLERAESYYAQALKAVPTWDAAYDLAKVQLKQQQWKTAEATLDPWHDVQGEGRAKVHQLVGRALEGQQRFLDAIPHYEIAGDAQGIAHAKEGQAALDHNREVKEIEDKIQDIEGKIGDLEDEEQGLNF